MKIWIFAAITAGWLASSAVAGACPTGAEEGARPRPRPIQNVSFQASELIDRAGRLESAAARQEQSARQLEQQASTLAERARVLQKQAALVNAADRLSILEVVDELTTRAAQERRQAANARISADQLRAEARSLRDRAVQLVRLGDGGSGTGGWRKRPVNDALPTTRTLTL